VKVQANSQQFMEENQELKAILQQNHLAGSQEAQAAANTDTMQSMLQGSRVRQTNCTGSLATRPVKFSLWRLRLRSFESKAPALQDAARYIRAQQKDLGEPA
jgi:hypothetical protein